MSKFGNNLFLGIDFGTSGMKIVLLSTEKAGRLKIIWTGYESYDSLENFHSQDRAAQIAYILKKLLRKVKGLHKAKVGISIAGQAAFVRLVKIPITPPKKLRQIVLYETQQQVPFPIKDVVWDFQIYGRSKKQLSVLLAAVKKELVLSILKVLDDFFITVDFIDVSNLALYNCLQYFYRDLEQTLILDCGAKTTNIIVVNPGKIWTRSLPIGGEDMTETIARSLKISKANAEQLKKDKGKVLMLYYGKEHAADEQQQKIAEIITNVLTDLANEIVKTLNFYKSQPEASIDFRRVLITGGVSRIENVDKFFENSLSIPTEKIDYFGFLSSSRKIEVEVNEFLGSAIGLALRAVGRSNLNINLLPPEQLQSNKFRKKRPFIIAAGVCLCLILLSVGVFLINKNAISARYLNVLEHKLTAYEQNKEAITQVESVISLYKRRSKTMAEALAARYTAGLILSNIADVMPKSIWIENLDMDLEHNYVLLQGNCEENLNVIGSFQKKLEKKDIIKDIKIDTVGKSQDGDIAFSFKIELNPINI